MNINFSIKQFLDLSKYVTDVRKNRRKGVGGTAEFFTPYSIVKRMCDKISDEDWADQDKNDAVVFLFLYIYNRL